jgi:predicted glutamine amidotransferase
MCVIIIKEAGQPLPPRKTLQDAWRVNPDGAGYMYPLDGEVVIRKGFMSFEQLYSSLRQTFAQYGLDTVPVVIHFRIATHGSVNRANTHPFPVCSDPVRLSARKTYAHIGLAHNGTIDGFGDRALGQSDTMDFTKAVVWPLKRLSGVDMLTRPEIRPILNAAAGSKLALLDGAGRLVTVGGFAADKDGYLCSNLYHEHATPTRYVRHPAGYLTDWADDWDDETGYRPGGYDWWEDVLEIVS